MIRWMSENLGTLITSLILILVVAGAIRAIIKDRKNGRSSCGGNCAHCNLCASCKKKN